MHVHTIVINKLGAFRVQILIWEGSYLHGAPQGPTQLNHHVKLRVGGSVDGGSPDTRADGGGFFFLFF